MARRPVRAPRRVFALRCSTYGPSRRGINVSWNGSPSLTVTATRPFALITRAIATGIMTP
jgi:hypothetical protein